MIKLTLDLTLRKQIHWRATEVQLSVSQFLADNLALHVGRQDLVYALGQGSLLTFRQTDLDPQSPHVIVRCHEEVYTELLKKAQNRGQKVATYIGDYCARLVDGDDTADLEFASYQEVLATSA
jgi:hypothetical protein